MARPKPHWIHSQDARQWIQKLRHPEMQPEDLYPPVPAEEHELKSCDCVTCEVLRAKLSQEFSETAGQA
jgi:hypothetical protein